MARRLDLIGGIELRIFERKALEVPSTSRTAIRQACVTVVLVAHVHLHNTVVHRAESKIPNKNIVEAELTLHHDTGRGVANKPHMRTGNETK